MFQVMQDKLEVVLDKLGTEKIEQNIGVQVSEVLADQREIDEKKNNLMVFNLAESSDEKEELDKVNELLSYVNDDVNIEQLNSKNLLRLGLSKPKSDQRPRPLKIHFDNPEKKWKFIKNAKKLRNSTSFKSVGLSLDKTTKERLEDDKLRSELLRERRNRPDDDLIIFRNKIIKREDKLEVARAMRSKPDLEAVEAAGGSD